MSHKFSFLQAFAGYYSWQHKFLGSCRQENLLKNLPVDLRAGDNRQVPNIRLLANMSESGTHICQLAGFSQIASDFSLLVDADSAYKYYGLVVNKFFGVISEFLSQRNIQHLNKYLTQLCLGWGFFQYEYLLQHIDFASINHFSFRKEYWFVADLPSTHRNIYQSFRFSQNCN
ncbi:MAG: hypothetical protein AAF349_08205 [Cyanobacteria bacterium P01_A01_bin.68]